MENKENKEIFIPDEIIDTPDGIVEVPSESILFSEMGTSRATGDTIVNNFRTGYKVQAVWKVNSQNVANNTSNVTVQVQLCSTGSSYTISSSATKNGSVTINGTKYSFTFSASLSGNQTKTVYTKTVDIPHNSDGSKSFSISATLGINVTLSGTYWGDVTASGTANLNSIPRTSSFTLNTTSGTIGSTQFTVTINRASTAFTHKVYYKFGSINWLGTSSATTSFSFTPSLSDCSQIPNATSGTGSIVVETYNGSTFIGSTSKSITLSVPTSVKPTISSLTATVVANGADTSYGYVKGKSKCKLVINGASGSHGSTIKSYSISGGGFSDSNSTFTTGALTTAGNITFTATVTDSRGRKSDAKTVTINVLDYTNPNITGFNVIRCDSSGNANDDGTYLKIWTQYTYSTLGGKNSLTTRAEFKKTSSSTWVNAGAISSGSSIITGSNGIATDSSYDVRFTITDNFSPISKSMVIPTAFVTMDFKKGGKGIAFGKVAEKDNLLDVGIDAKFDKNIQISDNNMLKVSSSNSHSGIGYESSTTDTFISNSVNNWLRLKSDKTMTYAGYKVYTAYEKPTASEIGALPTGGGSVSGQLQMTGTMSSSNMPFIRCNTSADNNGYGDGCTHIGYRGTDGKYYHYFRGTGAMNINCTGGTSITGALGVSGVINGSNNINSAYSINIGSYEEAFRSVNCRRTLSGTNFECRYGVSYNGIKQSSSSTNTNMWGGVIEAYNANAGSATRRYLFSNTGFYPLNDNASYCGASSHRWSALYCSTGTVYSSSKDEKDNIEPLNNSVFGARGKSFKELIREGIKDTNMYSYKYRVLGNNDTFIGFLGQELEENHPEFFKLIGSSYEKEIEECITEEEVTDENNVNPTVEIVENKEVEKVKQYDIRESSVIGVLWSALQDTLIENELQEERIQELENTVKTLTDEISKIKEILNIA